MNFAWYNWFYSSVSRMRLWTADFTPGPWLAPTNPREQKGGVGWLCTRVWAQSSMKSCWWFKAVAWSSGGWARLEVGWQFYSQLACKFHLPARPGYFQAELEGGEWWLLGEGLVDGESVTLPSRQDAEMCQELEKPQLKLPGNLCHPLPVQCTARGAWSLLTLAVL